jgi:uncharacterized sulfatase
MMRELNRRRFLGLLGAGIAGTAWTRPSRASAQRNPNIVLVFADDLGVHQLRCYGNDFYETPNLDQLASQGMRFTNAYAAAPVCSPTRAGLMTGKYPARLHCTDYIPGNRYPFAKLKTPDWTKHLPLEETTIAELLKEAGYACGHFGKWHLNQDKEYQPGRPGDPRSQGFDDVLATRKPKSQEAEQAAEDPDYDAHHIHEITDRAVAFMKAHRDTPFFCYVPHHAIHTPLMEYAPLVAKYAGKPDASEARGNHPIIGAMVETLDKSIGRLMDTVDELGLADDTVFIFYADNGDLFGREHLKPLYGAKADLHEGGIREPLIVRWPGVVKPGTECAELVSSIDFLPTFAAMAGQQVSDPEVDGISLLPALKQTAPLDGISLLPALKQTAPLGRDTLYWHYPHYHTSGIAPSGAIRDGKYKLIEWFEKSIEGPDAEGALALYDLEEDEGERHNLAPEMPKKARQMCEKLAAWRRSVNAQEMERNPFYDPAKAERR